MVLAHRYLTKDILGAAIDVHRALGPGLLENAYRQCLMFELTERGLAAEAEVPIPLIYKDVQLDCGFRADIIVRNAVLLELKCVERFLPVHDAQLLTYLKLCRLNVGLLINFNTSSLRNGIRRLIR